MTEPASDRARELGRYITARLVETDRIDDERRRALDDLAAALAHRLRETRRLDLLFVCTHNSRRSHMGQIWAHAAAWHFDLPHIVTASGGTEPTAFHPNAVAALRRAGFAIDVAGLGPNPVHRVRAAAHDSPLRCWSKRIDDPANPRDGFVAIMLCTSADRACPSVPGAALRIALPYDDPGAADGTPHESATYDACCARIAREWLDVVGRLRERA